MERISGAAVASTLQLEFLDLRHFRAHDLRALLEEESALWRERLRWDYRGSADLLLQYVDSHLLVGYVAIDQSKICGYTFCVQEQAKAVIGDVFASRANTAGISAAKVETRLLDHLLETLCHTPGLERMEAQLLLHPHGEHRTPFENAGFQLFPRLFMERSLDADPAQDPPLFSEISILDGALRMRRWRDTDFDPATHIIAAAYAGHIDSEINDQYRSISGAHRFLHNIVRFPGCGHFEPTASWVVFEPLSGNLQGVLLSSRVSAEVGHITQVCVSPDLRRQHIGQSLLEAGAASLHQIGCKAVTLTVTEANHSAVALYRKLGYHVRHTFDAMLWTAKAAS
ncbi:MAG TPA: N-acetyltransferase [Acidobacteriaceae bacterium]|nr:N-acetyltransferase [Acidobacteriaceae bacterium]